MNAFRRRFLQNVGLTSTAALLAKAKATKTRMLAWHVTGFTCVTCAVGLETLLKRAPGVLQVSAKYPEGAVRIEYDPEKVGEQAIERAIAEMGFRVEPRA